jgi:hypothetical protein
VAGVSFVMPVRPCKHATTISGDADRRDFALRLSPRGKVKMRGVSDALQYARRMLGALDPENND